MDLLLPSESELAGRWVESNAKVIADSVCERIDWLVNNHLQKIGTSKCGWELFFTDPIDGRFWLLTYPQSHMHGGGPPVLKVVATEGVKNIVTV
ncbi:Imm27 family immunity protein [Alteromonas stellipolaris]|uniref:Imm27 family immunity protein n=1 Tax=Alteromonas stellipolaris TaxID=233316 RepID=UPI00273736A8|nr:Imm27 family immunity protein [Alteromonas stellipolaris]MDP2538158.1 Imm27 family immunity protein [Alteromonas stellipolaris]